MTQTLRTVLILMSMLVLFAQQTVCACVSHLSIEVQSVHKASSDMHHIMHCEDETPTNEDDDCAHCEYSHVLKSDTSIDVAQLPLGSKHIGLTSKPELPPSPFVKRTKEPRFHHLAQGPPTRTPVTLKIRLLN